MAPSAADTPSRAGYGGYLYGLAAALVWGAQPVVASFGYRAGMSALDLTLLRFTVSGAFMLPYFLRHGVRDAAGLGWPHALLVLLLVGPLYNLVLIGGLQWAPATHSALIYPACTPVFTAALAAFSLKEKEKVSVPALGLLLAGVLVVKLGGVQHTSAGPDAWRGDLLFALAALMWSVYTVLMRRWHAAPLAVVAVVQVGGLLFLPWYFFSQSPHLAQLDGRAVVLQALYLGLIVSILSVLSFNLAVRLLGAKAALFTALMPVVGVGLSVLLLGEALTPALLAGTAMIVLGLVLALKKKR